MAKIGPNDSCPCGKGKKYKKCCRDKKEFPWKTYSETDIIKGLINASKEFAAFYNSERKKIVRPIIWAHDISLPYGIDYSCTRYNTGERIIRLRNIPVAPTEAVNIAHEMVHLILDSEGFPCVGADKQFEFLAAAMQSMLQDLVVDSRLSAFGFNMKGKYIKEFEDSLHQLKQVEEAPINKYDRLRWILNYASRILDGDLFIGNTEIYDEFRKWFDNRFSDISKEGYDLVAQINNIGYETPPKMTLLLKKMIDKYNVSNVMSVKIIW